MGFWETTSPSMTSLRGVADTPTNHMTHLTEKDCRAGIPPERTKVERWRSTNSQKTEGVTEDMEETPPPFKGEELRWNRQSTRTCRKKVCELLSAPLFHQGRSD